MKVIIYEGLFGILLGSQMTKAFKKALPGVPCETRSWTSRKSVPRNAFILGHSLGAYKAWQVFKEGDVALITVDFRSTNRKHYLDYYHDGHENQHNFLQLGLTRGYRLAGIKNNILDIKGLFAHMRAPHHPKVIAKIQEVWNGEKKI